MLAERCRLVAIFVLGSQRANGMSSISGVEALSLAIIHEHDFLTNEGPLYASLPTIRDSPLFDDGGECR